MRASNGTNAISAEAGRKNSSARSMMTCRSPAWRSHTAPDTTPAKNPRGPVSVGARFQRSSASTTARKVTALRANSETMPAVA